MNYSKSDNRKKLILFWNGEVEKKLIRCSKEFGFYPKLKKVLSPGTFRSGKTDVLNKIIDDTIKELSHNRGDVLDFINVLDVDNVKYPVYTALHSKIHFSHLISFALIQSCKLEYSKTAVAFAWVTKEIFKDHKLYAYRKKIAGYTKLLLF